MLDEMSKHLYEPTDKGSGELESNHNYLVKYEEYLQPIRGDIRTVLELGVDLGGSIELWSKYFPDAQIHGVDYDTKKIEKCKEWLTNKRVTLYATDYTDLTYLSPLLANAKYSFDIIIDDGNHDIGCQLGALRGISKYLNRGGYYFLEDVLAQHKPQVMDVLGKFTDLEFVEDYCDERYLPQHHGNQHMFIFRRPER